MKVYSGLNDQTIIPIPRSGLVQKYLTFTRTEESPVRMGWKLGN